MIYILITMLILLVIACFMLIYTLRTVIDLKNQLKDTDASLLSIAMSIQRARDELDNLSRSSLTQNIAVVNNLSRIQCAVEGAHTMAHTTLHEMETIGSFMEISTNTLREICDQLHEKPRKHALVQQAYKTLVDIYHEPKDNTDPPTLAVEEVIGLLGEYLDD